MRKIGVAVIIILVIVFAYEGYNYLDYRSKNAVSDAGFVKSDSLGVLNFKVGGKIDKLLKQEGDAVKKGELLASIDDRDFIVTRDKVANDIKSLSNTASALVFKKQRIQKEIKISKNIAKNSIESFKQNISSLKLAIKANLIKLSLLYKNTKRYKNLLNKKLISKNKFEQMQTSKNSLKNSVQAQKKKLISAQTNLKNIQEQLNIAINKELVVKELSKTIESLKYKQAALKDVLKEVNNKISYCNLYSPYDGIIAKRFVNNKRVIAKGYPVYAIVNPKDIYAEVLLSEKKLQGVRKGDSVKIQADALPNKTFKGVVESILPTSASTFSLVPRDIASGEFTKLDQRFIVRIRLEEKEGLKVGMSLNVAIKRDKNSGIL